MLLASGDTMLRHSPSCAKPSEYAGTGVATLAGEIRESFLEEVAFEAGPEFKARKISINES
jgi:hypothetical protein